MHSETESKGKAVLRWRQCEACGRVGFFNLFIRRRKMANGENARKAFSDDRLLAFARERS
jgi:transcriptional regulator NrdR family protein